MRIKQSENEFNGKRIHTQKPSIKKILVSRDKYLHLEIIFHLTTWRVDNDNKGTISRFLPYFNNVVFKRTILRWCSRK